jgi:hypothetical protein
MSKWEECFEKKIHKLNTKGIQPPFGGIKRNYNHVIGVYHPIPRLTQNGSRILISDPKLLSW